MLREEEHRCRLRVVTATGVDTMALVVAPDTLCGEEYRRIIVGDLEVARSLLLDTIKDVVGWSGSGAVLDLSDLFQEILDVVLEEALEGQPLH